MNRYRSDTVLGMTQAPESSGLDHHSLVSVDSPRPAGLRRLLVPAFALFALALTVRLLFLVQMDAYPRLELIRNGLDDQVIFHL